MDIPGKVIEWDAGVDVAEALHRLKKIAEKERRVEAYEAGYRRIPEDPALAEALAWPTPGACPGERGT